MMAIDFTDMHVRRISDVGYSDNVCGSSLSDLAEKAVKSCTHFFGGVEFRVTSFEVDVLVRDLKTGEARVFTASFRAAAPAAATHHQPHRP